MSQFLRRFVFGSLVLLLAASPVAAQRLRIMAANISSGNLQSYPLPGPGTRIFMAIEPDVVLIQEFNVNSTSMGANDEDDVEAWVDAVFGSDFHFFREPGGESIANGLISRWPIVESGEWRDTQVNNRDFAYARIDIPGEVDLWVVSVHLLTSGTAARATQARNLVAAIRNHPVPEDDYLVIGGDFNTGSRNEPAIATLRAVVDTMGPFPNDGGSPTREGTNANRGKPYDWVLADAELTTLETAVNIGDFTFPDGLVFDSRVFTQDDLDESFPGVRRADSGATMMQHMAVIRDFRLGAAPGPDFEIPLTEIDFGTRSASATPHLDTTVRIEVRQPVQLSAVAFSGSHAAEFSLASPDLSQGPVTLSADTNLAFAWKPAANDDEPRDVTATLIFASEPGAIEVHLRGRAAAQAGNSGGPASAPPLDLGGYRLIQTGGDASLTFPPGTLLPPGGLLVIGRAANRAEFEAFWGPFPPQVLYLNGGSMAGDPGFPLINGGERYRIVGPNGEAIDPASGELPAAPLLAGHQYQRSSTNSPTFEISSEPRQKANPGRFAGTATGQNRPVISEISDATNMGGFVFEFIEIYYDAGSQP